MNRLLFAMLGIIGFGLLAFALMRTNDADDGVEDSKVVLPETAPAPAAAKSSAPIEAVAESGVAPEMEARILRDAGDPGARLRAVRFVDKQQRMGCGEIMRTNTNKFVRFVWLGEPAKFIAEENGGGAYAQVAPLCYGKGATGV